MSERNDRLRKAIGKLLEITCLTGDEPDIEDQIIALIKEAKQEVWTRYRSGHLTAVSIAVEEAKKEILISIGKEAHRLDKSVYLVPDYHKYREALKEMGVE